MVRPLDKVSVVLFSLVLEVKPLHGELQLISKAEAQLIMGPGLPVWYTATPKGISLPVSTITTSILGH
jgi:hypothetical protein